MRGTFQTLSNRWEFETFHVFEVSPDDAAARAQRWFEDLAQPQFETPSYDENGAKIQR